MMRASAAGIGLGKERHDSTTFCRRDARPLFLVAAAIKSLEAQTPAGSRRVTSDKPAVASITECSNQFTFDLYSRLRANQGNFFCSPASLYTALAMTSVGAAGETAAELARTLHCPRLQATARRGDAPCWPPGKRGDKKQGFRLSVANRLRRTG